MERSPCRRRPPPDYWNQPASLPFQVVLAVIAGLLDLIPQVGVTIAGLILVLAGLTVTWRILSHNASVKWVHAFSGATGLFSVAHYCTLCPGRT